MEKQSKCKSEYANKRPAFIRMNQIFTSNQHHKNTEDFLIKCICWNIAESNWCQTADSEIKCCYVSFPLSYISNWNFKSFCKVAYPTCNGFKNIETRKFNEDILNFNFTTYQHQILDHRKPFLSQLKQTSSKLKIKLMMGKQTNKFIMKNSRIFLPSSSYVHTQPVSNQGKTHLKRFL